MKQNIIKNEDIQTETVRLLNEAGQQMGVVTLEQALQMAKDANVDLVLISDKSVPPVCKLIDYNKYKFQQAKREKEIKKKQKTVEVKEIKLTYNIGAHDMQIKANNAKRILAEGDKVKLSLRFKGREIVNAQRGVALMQDFIALCNEIAIVEKQPALTGNMLIATLTPSTEKK